MSRNQKGFSAIEGLLIFIIVAIIAGAGWYVWDSNKKTNNILSNTDKGSNVVSKGCGVSAVSAKVKASNNYKVPCEIGITVKIPSSTNVDDIKRMIQPINGEVEVNDEADKGLAESGVYFIKVPPGTEDNAIKYLKSQTEIESASQNSCCATAN
jgi:flagellin-like protein